MKLHNLLIGYAESRGFALSKRYAGGGYKDRVFALSMEKRATKLTVETFTTGTEQEEQLLHRLEELKEKLDLEELSYGEGRVLAVTKSAFLIDRRDVYGRIDRLLDELCLVLDENSAPGGCLLCSSGEGLSGVLYSGKPAAICGKCEAEALENIASRRRLGSRDLKRGAFGALLFGALGLFLWLLLAGLGHFAAVSGAAISLLASLGYTLFGGRKIWLMAVVVLTVTLLYILLGSFGELVLLMSRQTAQGLGTAVKSGISLLFDPLSAPLIWRSIRAGLISSLPGGIWAIVLIVSGDEKGLSLTKL